MQIELSQSAISCHSCVSSINESFGESATHLFTSQPVDNIYIRQNTPSQAVDGREWAQTTVRVSTEIVCEVTCNRCKQFAWKRFPGQPTFLWRTHDEWHDGGLTKILVLLTLSLRDDGGPLTLRYQVGVWFLPNPHQRSVFINTCTCTEIIGASPIALIFSSPDWLTALRPMRPPDNCEQAWWLTLWACLVLLLDCSVESLATVTFYWRHSAIDQTFSELFHFAFCILRLFFWIYRKKNIDQNHSKGSKLMSGK